jgi:hypothetical protein
MDTAARALPGILRGVFEGRNSDAAPGCELAAMLRARAEAT